MNQSAEPPDRAAVPTAAEVASYYDGFSARLKRDLASGNRRVEAALARAFGEIRSRQAAGLPLNSALDVGCGIGWTTSRLAAAVGAGVRVTGVDISPENIRTARERFGGRGVAFAESDLTVPPEGGPWDLICMIDVYEHLPAQERAVYHRTLDACLADGGTLFLTTPSPFHQAYLREHRPDELQVVDETVALEDFAKLAADVGGTVALYEMVGVWRTCDYTHVSIRRSGCYAPLPRRPPSLPAKIRRSFSRGSRAVRTALLRGGKGSSR